MTISGLAVKSLRNRRFGATLTVLSIALAVVLLLGVERIRHQVRASFVSTVSGTDLIVGARSGPVQLLLYSVFRIGNPTQSIGYRTYEAIAAHPQVAWTVPLSLGDSHRGFPVVGTTQAYFDHYRYARGRALAFTAGGPFAEVTDTVVGAEVAAHLGYGLGDSLIVAHGAGEVSFVEHADKPFRIVGVLERTGTPVDRAVHVSLDGMERLHEHFGQGPTAAPADADPLATPRRSTGAGARSTVDKSRDHAHAGHGEEGSAIRDRSERHAHDHAHAGQGKEGSAIRDRPERHAHEPETISAFLVGLTSRGAAPAMLRSINEYRTEPLTAIMPAVALQELWEITGVAETTLRVISAFVLVVGLMGMLTALLAGLDERRREMAVLRSVGARPAHVFGLVVGEAGVLTVMGIALGVVLLAVVQMAAQPLLGARLGLDPQPGWPSAREFALLAAIAAAGLAIGVIPGARVYRYSLIDGMTMRI